jgi:hypothetical protein
VYIFVGRGALQISSRQHRGPNFRSGGGFAGEGFEVELVFFDFRRQLECRGSSRPASRERLNPSIGSDPLFYPAMVLLDPTIEVLAGAYLHLAGQGSNRFQFGHRPVGVTYRPLILR